MNTVRMTRTISVVAHTATDVRLTTDVIPLTSSSDIPPTTVCNTHTHTHTIVIYKMTVLPHDALCTMLAKVHVGISK